MPEDTAPSRVARAAAPVVPVAIVAILLLTMIGLSIWYLTRREPLVIQGEVQSQDLRHGRPCRRPRRQDRTSTGRRT